MCFRASNIWTFFKRISKLVAKPILKNTKYIFARDDKSLSLVEKITKRNDIIIASDIAMLLPYFKGLYNVKKVINLILVSIFRNYFGQTD